MINVLVLILQVLKTSLLHAPDSFHFLLFRSTQILDETKMYNKLITKRHQIKLLNATVTHSVDQNEMLQTCTGKHSTSIPQR